MQHRIGPSVKKCCKFTPKKDAKKKAHKCAFLMFGGADGTRTRDLRRDRPAF
jgi:hypothetical protein